MRAVLRGDDERVMPLELFFDLVFVLAITQCTALMAHEPTWSGLGQGPARARRAVVAWVGYAWLTSVVDPEEGVVRAADLRRDGGAARRRALRAARVRRHARCCSPARSRRVRVAHIALFVLGEPRRPGAARAR